MGKVKKHVEGRTKDDRAKTRKDLGSLKSLTVQPKTRARYDNARQLFYKFLRKEGLEIPRTREALDGLVGEYLEHLWSSGEGRGLASDTLASLQDFDPTLRGRLVISWRLLKAWHVNEIPNRAPPIPEIILQAILGWAIFHEHHLFALSVAVCFYGMLRTGELFDVTLKSLFMTKRMAPAVIALGLTKAGKRAGASESITLRVDEVLRRLWQWRVLGKPLKLVSSPTSWRSLFAKCLTALKLDHLQFRPYSLRRGGATFWFQKHGSFDRLLIDGRWQAPKTARIYLNEGLALLAEMKVPHKELLPFVKVCTNSLSHQLPKLEHTASGSSGGRGVYKKKPKMRGQKTLGEGFVFGLFARSIRAWESLGLARPQGIQGGYIHFRFGVNEV